MNSTEVICRICFDIPDIPLDDNDVCYKCAAEGFKNV